MCRHLGYIGPAMPVSALVLDPEHSLLRQSWAPADMRHGGTINADGFGVGWFAAGEVADAASDGPLDAASGRADEAATAVAGPAGATAGVGQVSGGPAGLPDSGGWSGGPIADSGAGPFERSARSAAGPSSTGPTTGLSGGGPASPGRPAVVYRRSVPMWTDTALPALLSPVRATAVLAAVRSATVGMPVVETAAAPFTDGRWLFSHNGVVRGWPESVAPLAAQLPVTDLMTLDAPTDAVLLWALVRARLRTGEAPEKALADVVLAVEAHAPNSRLNLMVTDGRSLTATAWTHSLSTLVTDTSVVIASEPYDSDPRWIPVPDRHLVAARLTAGAPSLAVHPLGTTETGSQ
jgi:glutamine amidotransferase